MTDRSLFNGIAFLSTLGIFGLLLSSFFGGMILILFLIPIIIIPLVILYIISLANTVFSVIKNGVNYAKIKVIAHGLLFGVIALFIIAESDLFKSKRLLTATLKDDQFHYTLILRKNGTCENNVTGIFGFQEVFRGRCRLCGDTIVFEKKPYTNDFIPDTLLIDRSANAIFLGKNKDGSFSREKHWLSYFEIH